MLRKFLSLVLVFFIGGLYVMPTSAESGTGKQAEEVSKLRSKVAKRGTGPRAKVKVTLLDGTKLQGYISEASVDNFTVNDARTGRNVVVEYSRVKELKGDGLSRGTKIALGVGIAAAAFTVIIGVLNAALDD